MNIKTLSTSHFWIIFLVILVFLLRQTGEGWGFPGTMHNDESSLIRTALGMRFDTLNPHHFDWPSLYFYFNYFFFWIFIKIRTQLQLIFGVNTMKELFPFWWGPELPFYYIGRTLSNISSVSIIFLTYLISLEISQKKRIALLSGIFLSVGFWYNYIAYFALSDSLLVVFMMLSFFFSLKILKYGSLKYYILSAIFAGLATSTKYHGALACSIILFAHLQKNSFRLEQLFNKKILLAAIFSILFFFIGTPFALLDWKTFTITENASGALWQLKHMGHATNWLYHIKTVIPENFGILVSILGYFGLVYFLVKNSLYRFVGITFLVIFGYIGTWSITRAHYTLPLFPFIAIFASHLIFLIKQRYKINKILFVALILLTLFHPLYLSSIDLIKRNREDIRIISGRWIDQNIPLGSTIISNNPRNGYFGGDLPVFDYDRYNYIDTSSKENKNSEYEEGFIILIMTKSDNWDLIYQLDSKYRTGKPIYIYKFTSRINTSILNQF